MSTKNVVEKLSLQGWKRASKGKNGNNEYRFFTKDDQYILTKESPSGIEKITQDYGVLSFESDTLLSSQLKNQKFESFEEGLSFFCDLLKKNEDYFIECSLNDILERSYEEPKLGEILKSLKCFFDTKKIEITDKFENEKVIEAMIRPNQYSEDVDNACYSIMLTYYKLTKELKFEITTD